MLKSLDHLVVAVPDLQQAVESYSGLGFTVVPGGRHTVGTHNALISFEDGSYLELIAFYEPRPDHRWWAPLRQGGGLVDYCFGTDDLEADTQKLREAGVQIGIPEEKNRIRPDGYNVRWMYSLPLNEHRGVAPFIIQDITPRCERVPAPRPHENGVAGVLRVVVALQELEEVLGWCSQMFGGPGEPVRDAELGASGFRFRLGLQEIDMVSATHPRSAVGDWIARRGPSPYRAFLTDKLGRTTIVIPS